MCLLEESSCSRWCVLVDLYCQVKQSLAPVDHTWEGLFHWITSLPLPFVFLNLALFDDPTCTSPRKPPISLNVSHEGQYLQVVTISSFILELQTVNVSHLLHHRLFEVWHVSLKTRRASPLCLARCPAREPCQDHPGRVPERVRPKVLFTSGHGFGGETVHQTFG